MTDHTAPTGNVVDHRFGGQIGGYLKNNTGNVKHYQEVILPYRDSIDISGSSTGHSYGIQTDFNDIFIELGRGLSFFQTYQIVDAEIFFTTRCSDSNFIAYLIALAPYSRNLTQEGGDDINIRATNLPGGVVKVITQKAGANAGGSGPQYSDISDGNCLTANNDKPMYGINSYGNRGERFANDPLAIVSVGSLDTTV